MYLFFSKGEVCVHPIKPIWGFLWQRIPSLEPCWQCWWGSPNDKAVLAMKFLLEGAELLTRQMTFCNLLNWWREARGFRLPYFSFFEWSLSFELREPCEAGEKSNGSGNKNRVLIFSYRRECLRILLFVIYEVPGSMTSVSPSQAESAGSLPLMNSRSFPGASFHYRIAAASQDSGFKKSHGMSC